MRLSGARQRLLRVFLLGQTTAAHRVGAPQYPSLTSSGSPARSRRSRAVSVQQSLDRPPKEGAACRGGGAPAAPLTANPSLSSGRWPCKPLHMPDSKLSIFPNSSLERSVVSPPRRIQRCHLSLPSPFAYLDRRAKRKGMSGEEYVRDIMGWVVVGCAGLGELELSACLSPTSHFSPTNILRSNSDLGQVRYGEGDQREGEEVEVFRGARSSDHDALHLPPPAQPYVLVRPSLYVSNQWLNCALLQMLSLCR